LPEPLREEALREAHRLAGALGTFGLDHGSLRAREAEDALRGPLGRGDGARLARIAADLRVQVDRRPTSAPAAPAAAAAARNDPPLVWVMARDWGLAETVRAELAGLGVALAEGDTDPAVRPDAVFLDLRAESLDAEWDTFAGVARRAPGVPVVAYTDRDTLLDRVRALKMGARFILQPPLPPGAIADAFAQVLPAPGAQAHTILTVDDDSAITEGLRALLEPQGFRVSTLNDPLRFWTELRGTRPDLLVLDVDMPHLNGIELCRVVRSDPAWRHVPILFLTARADRETIYRVFAAGADDYLSKPIVGPELVSRIRNRLDRRR
ncbi:MAG TPA: response regulator, partial [Longimicrobium sp.]|nr:response regulator [Longimicrobium sp.]